MCEEAVKEGEGYFLYLVLIIMEIIIVFFINHNRKNPTIWTTIDTIFFVTSLILLRTMYIIVKKYNYTTIKPILDITLIVLFFFNLRKLYNVATKSKQT